MLHRSIRHTSRVISYVYGKERDVTSGNLRSNAAVTSAEGSAQLCFVRPETRPGEIASNEEIRRKRTVKAFQSKLMIPERIVILYRRAKHRIFVNYRKLLPFVQTASFILRAQLIAKLQSQMKEFPARDIARLWN